MFATAGRRSFPAFAKPAYALIGAAVAALFLLPRGARAQLLLEDDRVIVGNEVNVNSTDLDFSPAYYRDGVVYVTTHVEDGRYRVEDERINTNIMKLGRAYRSFSGVLSDAEPFYSELSSTLHEGPVTFDTTYTRIYFTRNDESGDRRRRRRNLRRLRIYTAELVDDEWVGERQVDFNAPSANTAHPALAPDGSLLVFSSDRDGGYGGMDLWGVECAGDDWGEPFNLGAAVNTDGNDVFPFLHEDGTLYFASTTEDPDDEEGHLDIYYSRRAGGTWGRGVSLGPPFNSDDDDFGLIVAPDNKQGYFSSDRAGGLGGDDIYSFQILTEREGGPLDLIVDVTDAATGAPIEGATVTYLNTADVSLARALSEGLITPDDETGIRLTGGNAARTNGAGRRQMRVSAGDFLLAVEREGYGPVQVPLTLDRGDLTLPIALEPRRGCVDLTIFVLEEATLRPVPGARVRLAGQTTGSQRDLATGDEGGVTYCVPCDEVYGIAATLGGRRATPASFDARGAACAAGGATTLTVYLGGAAGSRGTGAEAGNPLVVGSVIQLPSVYYPFNRWELSTAARNDLNYLAALLNRYPGMRIELGSHTDAQGSRAYNTQLSQRRATEAKRYLVQEAGIAAPRITAIGYGESRPRNRCVDGVRCSGREHRENRRTEIEITFVEDPVAIPATLREAAGRGFEDREFTSAPSRSGRGGSEGRGPGSPARAVPTSAGGKRYWVVAGTFGEDRNAVRRQRELEALGYVGADVVSFDGDVTRAVVAGRFAGLAEAAQFSRALKEAHRIPAYVRRVDAAPRP